MFRITTVTCQFPETLKGMDASFTTAQISIVSHIYQEIVYFYDSNILIKSVHEILSENVLDKMHKHIYRQLPFRLHKCARFRTDCTVL